MVNNRLDESIADYTEAIRLKPDSERLAGVLWESGISITL